MRSLIIARLVVLQAHFLQAVQVEDVIHRPDRKSNKKVEKTPQTAGQVQKPAEKKDGQTQKIEQQTVQMKELADISANDADNKAWAEVTKWIVENGGKVTPGIHGKPTMHSGNMFRGVVTDVDLKSGNILEIPSRLWINLHSFPTLEPVELGKIKECEKVPAQIRDHIKIAAGVALETKAKDKSFFWPYLKNLPGLNDYKSFYPRLAEPDLLADFHGLPFVHGIKTMQMQDKAIKECFKGWQQDVQNVSLVEAAPDHPHTTAVVAGITWDEFVTALSQFRTRNYYVNDQPTLVPAVDLMNTGVHLNTNWDGVSTTSFDVRADVMKNGTELLDSYCVGCNNTNFLSNWGVYLEDNDLRLRKPSERCDKFAKGVRKHLEDALETSEDHLKQVVQEKWQAPRCKSSMMKRPQGPLRCSLARLSWQTCRDVIGASFLVRDRVDESKTQAHLTYVTKKSVLPDIGTKQHPHSLPSNREFVDLIGGSSRHRVHRRLLAADIGHADNVRPKAYMRREMEQ